MGKATYMATAAIPAPQSGPTAKLKSQKVGKNRMTELMATTTRRMLRCSLTLKISGGAGVRLG